MLGMERERERDRRMDSKRGATGEDGHVHMGQPGGYQQPEEEHREEGVLEMEYKSEVVQPGQGLGPAQGQVGTSRAVEGQGMQYGGRVQGGPQGISYVRTGR